MGQEECQANTTTALVCESILFLICGPDVAELDPVNSHIIIMFILYTYWLVDTGFQTLIPLIVSHSPAGTSVQNMLHYAQEYNYGIWLSSTILV